MKWHVAHDFIRTNPDLIAQLPVSHRIWHHLPTQKPSAFSIWRLATDGWATLESCTSRTQFSIAPFHVPVSMTGMNESSPETFWVPTSNQLFCSRLTSWHLIPNADGITKTSVEEGLNLCCTLSYVRGDSRQAQNLARESRGRSAGQKWLSRHAKRSKAATGRWAYEVESFRVVGSHTHYITHCTVCSQTSISD